MEIYWDFPETLRVSLLLSERQHSKLAIDTHVYALGS